MIQHAHSSIPQSDGTSDQAKIASGRGVIKAILQVDAKTVESNSWWFNVSLSKALESQLLLMLYHRDMNADEWLLNSQPR